MNNKANISGAKRSRQRGKTTTAEIDRAARDRRAVELRHQGATFDEIAATMDMSNKSVAYKAVTRGLQRWAGADVEELRAVELSRTDEVIARLWPLVATDPPEMAAVDRLMKVLHYRARITGLYAPQQHQVGVQVAATVDLRVLEAAELLQQRPELAAVIDATLETTATETSDDAEGDADV